MLLSKEACISVNVSCNFSADQIVKLLPTVDRRNGRTCNSCDDDERSRWRPGRSAMWASWLKYGGARPCSIECWYWGEEKIFGLLLTYQRGHGERLCKKDCQARNLNREDDVDRGRWKKLIKIGWWAGWWVGECFFWYQLTQVVSDKGP